MLAPTSAASSAIPSARSSTHWTGRSRGAARPTVSECAVPPIALMSERFAAAAWRPTSRGRGPVAAEVASLDQQVGGDDDVAPRGAQHRGVVAGADEDVRPLLEPPGQGTDQAELPDVCERGVRREVARRMRHERHLTRSRPSAGPSVPHRRRPVGCERSRLPSTEGVEHGRPGLHPDPDRCRQGRGGRSRITDIKGVILAEDVTGPYDVIVRAEARNVDELGKLVVAKVQTLDGITRTLTCPVVHI